MKIDSEIKKEVQEELKYLLVIVLVILIMLKIAFYKESVMGIIKFGLSFLYFSLIPGYFILFNFRQSISRNLRFILAFPIGMAIYVIIAYYLNIFIDLKYLIFLPVIIIILSATYVYYQIRNKLIDD